MILIDLFLTFLKIGAFTFGGGYAMLPLIQSEVERHGWLTKTELVDFIAVSESTPGPLAINMATFVGIRTGGIFGAVCATFGVVLPSFLIILIVSKFYEKFCESRVVDGAMYGLRPAVIGLIGAAFLSVGMTVFFPNGFETAVFSRTDFFVSLGVFVLGAALAFKKIHPIAVIGISAVIGIIAGYILDI
ncbi:MAG: chromate transporter [Oscillospiraceae bacterium]|nr:chromate transporter [Oscillospiraceae bacterium]